MKTAEEKALKLVDRFENLFSTSYPDINKKLALICVDEILKAIPKLIGGRALFKNPDIDYWEEVKSEIEKL